MRNILMILALTLLTLMLTSDAFAQVEDIYGNKVSSDIVETKTQEAIPYKMVIAFNKGRKKNKAFKQAFVNIQTVGKSYGVEVFEAEEDMVVVKREGNKVLAFNVQQLTKKHDKGFLILMNNEQPKVITDMNSPYINKETIADIMLIDLGLDTDDDMVVAF